MGDAIEPSVEAQRARRLWLRVIQQTVAEAKGASMYGVPRRDVEYRKRLARKWLTTRSRSFLHVTTLAGFSHQQIKLLWEQNRQRYGNSGHGTNASR
jgi:hypothetical protein